MNNKYELLELMAQRLATLQSNIVLAQIEGAGQDPDDYTIRDSKNYNSGFEEAFRLVSKHLLTNRTKSGFHIVENSPDDIVIYQHNKKVLFVSFPEKSTQWNTELP